MRLDSQKNESGLGDIGIHTPGAPHQNPDDGPIYPGIQRLCPGNHLTGPRRRFHWVKDHTLPGKLLPQILTLPCHHYNSEDDVQSYYTTPPAPPAIDNHTM